jgi:hypothetical protein
MPVCSKCGSEVYNWQFCQNCGRVVTPLGRREEAYRPLRVLTLLSGASILFWGIPQFLQIIYLSYFLVPLPINTDVLIGLFLILSNGLIALFSFLSCQYVKLDKIKVISIICWSLFVFCNFPFVMYFFILS